MSFVKCFDVVNMVLEEATEQFAPLWQQDSSRAEQLRRYCGIIDSVVDEFGGTCFEVEVDEDTMQIHLELVCQKVIFQENSKLLSVIRRSAVTRIVRRNGNELGIHFVFSGVWQFNATRGN